MSEQIAVIAAIIYGVMLTPFAMLGIAEQVRRWRARRAPPPVSAWAVFDVPTYIRRRASGRKYPE